MNTKHTPGPWKQHFVQNSHVMAVYATSDQMEFIADIGTPFGPDGDAKAEANARLIAAAPELLAFAQMVAEGGYDMADLMTEARAAIAKATNSL